MSKSNESREKFERIQLYVVDLSAGADLVEVYDKWAPQYDDDWNTSVRYGEDQIFEEVSRYLSNQKDALILDVGSGTGYAGIALRKRGFENIEAVDASANMLEIAQKQGVYKTTYCQYFGSTPLPVPDGTYDCIVTVKTVVPHHFNLGWLEEFDRLLKPGGYFMLQGNYNIWLDRPEYHVDMATGLERLVNDHKWTQIVWSLTDNYFNVDGVDTKGLLLVYKKL